MVAATGNLSAQNGLMNQTVSASQNVTQAIKQASAQSGVDFAYLLNKASQESGLNPTAKAKGSSATGLFQFVEQTWLHVVKTYGDKYGMSAAASRISVGSDGVARVTDPQAKEAILALRKNPAISADMAAELTNENKAKLESNVGGSIGSTELYLAHFLGASGASDFLNTMRATPNASAASVLPEAASANPSVFYDKSGQPRSLSQIYQHFAQKFSATPTVVADAAPITSVTVGASAVDTTAGLDALGATSSAYAPSVMSTFNTDTTTSSPFAAMVIAQMDVESLKSSGDDEQKKKSALSVIGLAG